MLAPTGADTASMETNNATKTIKPIEIFKPGSFTAVNGERYTFSSADVAELAASYDPATSDAPFVVGHPKLTSPRFGHVGSLSVNSAGVLCATPANVVPEFAEAVNAGYYPKVSASIFLPSEADAEILFPGRPLASPAKGQAGSPGVTVDGNSRANCSIESCLMALHSRAESRRFR